MGLVLDASETRADDRELLTLGTEFRRDKHLPNRILNGPREGALVVVDAGTFQGAPYAQRTTTYLGPKGPTVVTSDRLWGVGPGRRVFEGRYKPLK